MVGRLSVCLYLRIQGAVARSRDEEGQTLAEYGLILSVVAVAVIVAAVTTFRTTIAGAFNGATNCLDGIC
ncbi:MAG: Flp family type IVb pilin [Chloroflexota bacterium]|nr:Flp family type IVb pilin [Chloroflexota bacterium]